jgi:hypothetical protein
MPCPSLDLRSNGEIIDYIFTALGADFNPLVVSLTIEIVISLTDFYYEALQAHQAQVKERSS